MKKFISSILILSMAAIGASNTFAVLPSDRNDPKCIDIRNLADERIIEYPNNGKKVCGCRTCEITAMTYDQMIDYVDRLPKKLKIATKL